jgi:hypothetical protein
MVHYGAAEQPHRTNHIDRLVNDLRFNRYEQAVKHAQVIIPTMGIDCLIRILAEKIDFSNNASSKFFDWMQQQQRMEPEHIEKPHGTGSGKPKEERHLMRDLQSKAATTEILQKEIEDPANPQQPAESYEALLQAINRQYVYTSLEGVYGLMEQVKNLFGIAGLMRLYGDLQRNQLLSQSLEGKVLLANLSREIQDQPAPTTSLSSATPTKQARHARGATCPAETTTDFPRILVDAMIHEGLEPSRINSIDLLICGNFAQQYFNAKNGAFRDFCMEGLRQAHNFSLGLSGQLTDRSREIIKKLVTEYKIHLMPTDDNFIPAVITLCRAIKERDDLQGVIHQIKIKPMLESSALSCQQYKALPKIVIYVYGSKDVVQRVLNNIYEVFKDWQGVDRTPAFNEKVTSFIYFAQGDRMEKIACPEYFEASGVYFKPDVTGTREDYHLTNPATK